MAERTGGAHGGAPQSGSEPPHLDPTVPTAPTLEAETVSGVGWMASSRAASQAMQFLLALALTRLLTPADFGLVGMAAVFSGLATVLADSGFAAGLIQRPTVEQRHLNTVFWSQVALGVLAGGALALAAPLIASFYNEPRAAPIIVVTAANFLLAAVGPVQYAILNRSMRFRTLFHAEVVGFAVSGPVAILLALAGAGPWSLVVRGLVANAASSLLLLVAARWRPTGGPDRESLAELTSFTRSLLAAKLLNFGTRNADNALIGRFLGADALGIYLRGYAILLLPSRNITHAVGSVMFASLSRLQEDKERVKRAYLKAISVIALVAMPAMAGLAVVAEEFVATAFGPRWAVAVPVIRVFCLVGVVESIGTSVGWIYQSQGRTDWFFRWGVGTSVVVLSAIGLGVAAGSVFWVAVAYAVAILILTYPAFAIPGRLIGMSFLEVVRAVRGVVLATCVMAAAAWSVGLLLPGAASATLLASRFAVGALSYALMLIVLRPAPFLDLRRIVAERLQQRSADAPPHAGD